VFARLRRSISISPRARIAVAVSLLSIIWPAGRGPPGLNASKRNFSSEPFSGNWTLSGLQEMGLALWEREWRSRVGLFRARIAMAALFKYFAGIAAVLSAVMVIFAMTISEIFVGYTAVAKAPVTERPIWNIERLKAEPDTTNIAQGSLSPIYPASPGKELLGKPVYTATHTKKLQEPVSAKRIDVRQALQLHKVPRQIYAASEQDRNYPQQSLSYTEERLSQALQPHMPVIFGHGIY
jgi:hypothetical protein